MRSAAAIAALAGAVAGVVAGFGAAVAIGAMEWFSIESDYPTFAVMTA